MTPGLVWARPASILLDLLFLVSLLLTVLSIGPVLSFHVCFASLTLMSFAHAGKALLARAIPGILAVTAAVARAVNNDELSVDELYEIPVLVIMMAFAAWSVSLHRTLVVQLQSQGERLRELHQASQAESQHQLLLTQRLDTFGQLSAGLAHNCRNVLTTIISVAERIEDTGPDPELQSSARQIQELSRQGGQLINDMLHRVRPDDDGDHQTDLNAVVEAEESSLTSLVGRGVDLQFELDPGSLTVSVGRSLLEQLLINLVINAKEATDGAGQVRVTTSRQSLTSQDPDGHPTAAAVLSVTDDGRGMSDQERARAFEPFFSTKKGSTDSAGLGLYTSLVIAEHVGGTIRIASERGQGTEVRVTLPLESAGSATSVVSPGTVEPDQLFGSETVLLVDDEDVLRTRLATTLALRGYDVIEAADADEAMTRAMTATVDLVVTDVVMPGMNGPDLVNGLARVGIDAPVLFISGDHQAGEFLPDEADLLAKPFSQNLFLMRVRRALSADERADNGRVLWP